MFNPPKIKMIPIRFDFDTDKDGVKDFRDCRPFNPKKQHTRPSRTMRKRLKAIPLFVTDKPPLEDNKIEHITETKKFAPKAQKEMYGIIKRYPSVVGEIEREKPEAVIYSSSPHMRETKLPGRGTFVALGETMPTGKRSKKAYIVVTPMKPSYTEAEIEEYGMGEDAKYMLEKELVGQRENIRKEKSANSLFHELRHQHQLKKGVELEERKKEVFAMIKDVPEENFKDIEEMGEIYKDIRSEKDAIEYAEKKIEEREKEGKKPTGEEITEMLDLD